jgi:polyketide synthase 12/myxalamid-type polyketide synthase MxaB
MDSRGLSFADEIGQATNGAGVTIVLNSLAGEAIDRSFACLAKGGTFLEIGKRGIWDDARVRALGKEIRYHVIDWGATSRTEPALVGGILRSIADRVSRGVLAALPARRFRLEDAVEGFRLMARAGHIGKIVFFHPRASGDCEPIRIRREGTYLITGGFRGLGLEVGKRLIEDGARSLVLTGRNAPDASVEQMAEQWRSAGARVELLLADVSRPDEMRRVIETIHKAFPPLRGVIHSAGVLRDAAFTQQEWTGFSEVLAPKVDGAWLLDRLTRHDPLDFFILFSSVASVLGSPGQANHASANAYLDALAWRRSAEGLPALSVNWGAWSQIGAAARLEVGGRIAARGIGEIAPASGLRILDRLLAERRVQAAVLPVEWGVFRSTGGERGRERLLEGLAAHVPPARAAAPAQRPRAEEFAGELARTPENQRTAMVAARVRDAALRVLGLDASRTLEEKKPLNEMGLDSLMAVELRNALSASIGRPLSATLLFDYPTIDALSRFLMREVLGEDRKVPDVPSAGKDDVLALVEELSDEEINRRLDEMRKGPARA